MICLFVGLVYLFLLAPILCVVLSSLGDSPLLVFPPTRFSFRWYGQIPAEFLSALNVSLLAATTTALLATLLGTGLALAIARGRGAAALNLVASAPLSVPHLAIGIALYQTCLLQWDFTGIELVGSFSALVAGHVVIALPYVVRSVSAGHALFDRTLEEASLTLGASRWRTLRAVTLRVLLPGIIAGGVLAFLASFDDVPVALFMGGGENSTTLPLKFLAAMEFSLSPAIMATSTLIILASVLVMLAMEYAFGVERFFTGRRSQ